MLLQLPCVRTLKYYIDANLESTGDSMEWLQESRKQYTELIKEKRRLQEENCSKGENVCITSNCNCTFTFMLVRNVQVSQLKFFYQQEKVR